MQTKISHWIMAVAVMFITVCATAHDGPQDKWQDKMRSEMIAFLTAETGITPAEAEKFWPVYNEAERSRRAAFKKVMQAYDALEEAVKAGLPAKELEKRIKAYTDAQEDSHELDGDNVEKYLRILPADKVARLLVAEEKFRRNQINRLHERSGSASGPQNGAPRGRRNPAAE